MITVCVHRLKSVERTTILMKLWYDLLWSCWRAESQVNVTWCSVGEGQRVAGPLFTSDEERSRPYFRASIGDRTLFSVSSYLSKNSELQQQCHVLITALLLPFPLPETLFSFTYYYIQQIPFTAHLCTDFRRTSLVTNCNLQAYTHTHPHTQQTHHTVLILTEMWKNKLNKTK